MITDLAEFLDDDSSLYESNFEKGAPKTNPAAQMAPHFLTSKFYEHLDELGAANTSPQLKG